MKRLYILSALLLSSCASPTEIVYLRSPAGQRVQCGPYDAGWRVHEKAISATELRSCVEDYQIQGYQRVPG